MFTRVVKPLGTEVCFDVVRLLGVVVTKILDRYKRVSDLLIYLFLASSSSPSRQRRQNKNKNKTSLEQWEYVTKSIHIIVD